MNAREPRDFRSDLPALRRVLVGTPTGAQIPLGQLADIQLNTGPPSIRDENGALAGFVFVDTYDVDLGTYVNRAKKLIADNIKLPPGYYIEWGGQYQYLLKAREKLKLIIPLTLLVIFVLLYLNFRNLTETLIVLLSVPFALVGGVWLLYLLGYNYSVAVAVGFIALAGVAAETGVVMIVYLDEAWTHLKQNKSKPATTDLYEAVMEGAVQRVRPKMMTVCAIIAGLLPILWGHGAGADTMKRIAAPMVGGMVSSTILTLLIIPAIYFLYRGHGLEAATQPAPKARRGKLGIILLAIVPAVGGGLWAWRHSPGQPSLIDSVLTQQVGGHQFKVFGRNEELSVGENPIRVEVSDPANGQRVDVGNVSFQLNMDMPGIQMQVQGRFKKTADPGIYFGTITIDAGGQWIARLGYDGPHGKGNASASVNVKR